MTILQLKSPQGLKHDITEMTLGRGTRYNYKSYSGTFTCPVCSRRRSANLNFVGHRGKVYCNGLKSAICHDVYAGTEILFQTPRAIISEGWGSVKFMVIIRGRPTKFFATREEAQAVADKHNSRPGVATR